MALSVSKLIDRAINVLLVALSIQKYIFRAVNTNLFNQFDIF